MDLSDKQLRFVDEYLIDMNGTQAAIRAGYSEKTATEQASRLLSNVKVREVVDQRRAELRKKCEITREKVLADIEAVKRDAMQKIADKDGNMVMLNHSAALKAAELHGKSLGIFSDKVELTGADGGPIDMNLEVAFLGANRAS